MLTSQFEFRAPTGLHVTHKPSRLCLRVGQLALSHDVPEHFFTFTLPTKVSMERLKRRSNVCEDLQEVWVDGVGRLLKSQEEVRKSSSHLLLHLRPVFPCKELSSNGRHTSRIARNDPRPEAGFLVHVQTKGGQSYGRERQDYVLLKHDARYSVRLVDRNSEELAPIPFQLSQITLEHMSSRLVLQSQPLVDEGRPPPELKREPSAAPSSTSMTEDSPLLLSPPFELQLDLNRADGMGAFGMGDSALDFPFNVDMQQQHAFPLGFLELESSDWSPNACGPMLTLPPLALPITESKMDPDHPLTDEQASALEELEGSAVESAAMAAQPPVLALEPPESAVVWGDDELHARPTRVQIWETSLERPPAAGAGVEPVSVRWGKAMLSAGAVDVSGACPARGLHASVSIPSWQDAVPDDQHERLLSEGRVGVEVEVWLGRRPAWKGLFVYRVMHSPAVIPFSMSGWSGRGGDGKGRGRDDDGHDDVDRPSKQRRRETQGGGAAVFGPGAGGSCAPLLGLQQGLDALAEQVTFGLTAQQAESAVADLRKLCAGLCGAEQQAWLPPGGGHAAAQPLDRGGGGPECKSHQAGPPGLAHHLHERMGRQQECAHGGGGDEHTPQPAAAASDQDQSVQQHSRREWTEQDAVATRVAAVTSRYPPASLQRISQEAFLSKIQGIEVQATEGGDRQRQGAVAPWQPEDRMSVVQKVQVQVTTQVQAQATQVEEVQAISQQHRLQAHQSSEDPRHRRWRLRGSEGRSAEPMRSLYDGARPEDRGKANAFTAVVRLALRHRLVDASARALQRFVCSAWLSQRRQCVDRQPRQHEAALRGFLEEQATQGRLAEWVAGQVATSLLIPDASGHTLLSYVSVLDPGLLERVSASALQVELPAAAWGSPGCVLEVPLWRVFASFKGGGGRG